MYEIHIHGKHKGKHMTIVEGVKYMLMFATTKKTYSLKEWLMMTDPVRQTDCTLDGYLSFCQWL